MSTAEKLRAVIDKRFGGRLSCGSHRPGGKLACAFEALSVAKRVKWTDNPYELRCFDIRTLNDAPWSSEEARAAGMIFVLDALQESLDWPRDRKRRFAEAVAIRCAQEVLVERPGMPKYTRDPRLLSSLAKEPRRVVAWAAEVAAAVASTEATQSEADAVLLRACTILVEEAARAAEDKKKEN